MVRRESFINKIREMRYVYKSTQKRTFLYRKIGGTHYISVPKADLLDDVFVASALRQAGEPEERIRSFIGSQSA